MDKQFYRQMDRKEGQIGVISSASNIINDDEIVIIISTHSQVFKTLSTLATRCRSNQAEIFSLVIAKIEEAENGFSSKRENVLENAIEELRCIASGSPGNVLAAMNIAKNFPAPMLASLMEKRDDMLRRCV